MPNTEQSSVAIYWDFENIHRSALQYKYGEAPTHEQKKEQTLDIDAIMNFVATLGQVSINRAYCNWLWHEQYQEKLLHYTMELIQMFPLKSSGKNGADIRLALDANENLVRFPHIETIVIVSGDSDFLSVSQKVKATGKTLIGIGCKSSTNEHWAHSCHEFKYYEIILEEHQRDTSAEQKVTARRDISSGIDLVKHAVLLLADRWDSEWVLKSRIHKMVMRLDSTFDPKSYGYTNLAELLDKNPAVFEIEKGGLDHKVRFIKESR